MEKATFDRLREIIYERSGIHLTDKKEALVSARIGKRLQQLGMCNYESYLDHLERDPSGMEYYSMLDAISTNVTEFFREETHFQFLRERIQEWHSTGQKHFRFWSAACSTGEEPYTIAMTVDDCLAGEKHDTRILATDISSTVLNRCKQGAYEWKKLAKVPEHMLSRYFQRIGENGHSSFHVKKELRNMIVFSWINLAQTPFPMNGPLDIVFCRNVMIYFDNPVRQRLLDEIHRLLKPGGYLIVGHAESLLSLQHGFKSVRPSIFKR